MPNGWRAILTRPSQEAVAAARWRALDTIEQTADLVASYARSAGEAAYRGDQVTLGVHVRQLRLCILSMIRLFKELEDGGADRPNLKAGDGMGGRES